MIKIFLKLLVASIIIFNFGSYFLVGNISTYAAPTAVECKNDKTLAGCNPTAAECKNDSTLAGCISAKPTAIECKNDKTLAGCSPTAAECKNDKTLAGCSTPSKSDGPSIGSLKACVVDKSEKDISSEKGNSIIRECIKSVINLVITLAVLISIASLVGYGIQLMNPMTESGKINGQIVERIKSLAIGGLILGSFGTILATINPATLTSNQLLGKPVIDSFREYISLGVKNAPPSKGVTGAVGGTGTTGTASTAEITTAIATVSTASKIDKAKLDLPANKDTKKLLQDAVDKDDECTDIFATGTGCVGYVKIEKTVLKSLNDAGLKSSYDANSSLKTVPSPVIANYDMTVTKDSNDTSGIYTATIKIEGKDETQKFKITGAAGQLCPVTNLFFQPAPKAGQTIIKAGCTLTILK